MPKVAEKVNASALTCVAWTHGKHFTCIVSLPLINTHDWENAWMLNDMCLFVVIPRISGSIMTCLRQTCSYSHVLLFQGFQTSKKRVWCYLQHDPSHLMSLMTQLHCTGPNPWCTVHGPKGAGGRNGIDLIQLQCLSQVRQLENWWIVTPESSIHVKTSVNTWWLKKKM